MYFFSSRSWVSLVEGSTLGDKSDLFGLLGPTFLQTNDSRSGQTYYTSIVRNAAFLYFCGMLYFLELNLGRINLARMTLLNVKIFISSNFMYFYPLLSIFTHHHHGHLRHYGHCSPHGHHSHQNPHWLFFFFGNVCQSVCISSKMDSNIGNLLYLSFLRYILCRPAGKEDKMQNCG